MIPVLSGDLYKPQLLLQFLLVFQNCKSFWFFTFHIRELLQVSMNKFGFKFRSRCQFILVCPMSQILSLISNWSLPWACRSCQADWDRLSRSLQVRWGRGEFRDLLAGSCVPGGEESEVTLWASPQIWPMSFLSLTAESCCCNGSWMENHPCFGIGLSSWFHAGQASPAPYLTRTSFPATVLGTDIHCN